MIDTLLALVEDPTISDRSILSMVGPPTFPHHCDVAGDIERLVLGRQARLILRARLKVEERSGRHVILVSHFPPELWAEDLVLALAPHLSTDGWAEWIDGNDDLPPGLRRLPIMGVRKILEAGPIDHSSERAGIILEEDADANRVLAYLRGPKHEMRYLYDQGLGLRQDVHARLGAPLAELVRGGSRGTIQRIWHPR